MKKIANRLARSEEGYAMLMVLILLLVGGLIIAPLMGFMGTGVIAGQIHENRMDELYAADAGVEDAIWKIKTSATELPEAGDDPWEYSITDVNGKQVNTAIEFMDDRMYKITSTATNGTSSSTTVEAYVGSLSFSFLREVDFVLRIPYEDSAVYEELTACICRNKLKNLLSIWIIRRVSRSKEFLPAREPCLVDQYD